MENLYKDNEEEQIEARIKQREAEILAEIDGPKTDSAGTISVIMLGLVIACVLALPGVGYMAWQKQRRAAVPPPTAAQLAQARPIVWYYTLREGLNAAAITKKPMMIDFYATWCGPCQRMDAETFTDPAVRWEAQNNFIAVKINAEYYVNDAARYNIRGYPTIIWTDSAGNERKRISGGYGPAEFLPYMQYYR